MASATMQLIEAVERLNMTGTIGDGMVATLHDLASMARLEQRPKPVVAQPDYARLGISDPEGQN